MRRTAAGMLQEAQVRDPFRSPPPEEVALPEAPLERVIAEVRFPLLLAAEIPARVAAVHERCRATFERVEEAVVVERRLLPDGLLRAEMTVWRFLDGADGDWVASLSRRSLVLETRRYRSRKDFVDRMRRLLLAVGEEMHPEQVERIGVRYIDGVPVASVSELDGMVRPELLGRLPGVGSDLLEADIRHLVARAPVENARLQVRWGWVPAGRSHDPVALEPAERSAWVLDLDAGIDRPGRGYEPGWLSECLERLAARCYSVFRWFVTDRFLEHHGGRAR